MSSVNKVILIGRLGGDPELRYTADGSPVATFNVATSEVWKDKGGNKQERTEWHRVVAWRKLGEISAEYLKKGKLVYIEGRIQSSEYEKDGVKRKTFEIIASNMKMIGGGAQTESGGGRWKTEEGHPVARDDDFTPEIEEDDIKM